MTSDSAIPNLESNSTASDADPHPIIPDAELDSVLLYLQLNSADAESDSATAMVLPAASPLEEDPPLLRNAGRTAMASLPVEAIAGLEPVSLIADVESDFGLLDVNYTDNLVRNHIQVQLQSEDGRLLVILPTETELPASDLAWSDIWQQLKLRLMAGDRLRTLNTAVHLVAHDRLLDSRQLQELAETFSEIQLQLKSVATSRRQTAIAAVTSGYSVEQLQPETSLTSEAKATAQPQADALYLEMTVRSGIEIRHPGTVILLGDLNPGGIVVAEGDILVWGRLRGIAHAGAGGNRECLIMALQMEPTQLRIADALARAPEKSPTQFFPEVAHITPQGIRIAKANDFSRNQLTRINQAP